MVGVARGRALTWWSEVVTWWSEVGVVGVGGGDGGLRRRRCGFLSLLEPEETGFVFLLFCFDLLVSFVFVFGTMDPVPHGGQWVLRKKKPETKEGEFRTELLQFKIQNSN
ncbi:hypothetical protein RHMOL_Rhmol13G0159700 [Rhododendron molle]|uniref:Uncharacterized protein n=1 Tax=Rhododendron molle TaxID=49168 RepID=A0ACC0L8B4_RHOML|nr:hypothetical protein RHMOL_Rhmol13G0159700 [Rhododendron molle]